MPDVNVGDGRMETHGCSLEDILELWKTKRG